MIASAWRTASEIGNEEAAAFGPSWVVDAAVGWEFIPGYVVDFAFY
jgi:hypothetical protein